MTTHLLLHLHNIYYTSVTHLKPITHWWSDHSGWFGFLFCILVFLAGPRFPGAARNCDHYLFYWWFGHHLCLHGCPFLSYRCLHCGKSFLLQVYLIKKKIFTLDLQIRPPQVRLHEMLRKQDVNLVMAPGDNQCWEILKLRTNTGKL